MFHSIRDLLQRWKVHHISLLGRVASVKMTILSKLLYLFQILPIPVPYMQLRKLQVDLVCFVCNYKRHIIPCLVLLASRSDGELAFPDLVKYYQVTQLRTLTSWFPQRSYNKWTEIEKTCLAPTHPNNLLWSANAEVDTERHLGSMALLRSLANSPAPMGSALKSHC